MNFTLNFDFTYAIEPSGVIALACIAIVGISIYGAWKIQQIKSRQMPTLEEVIKSVKEN